MEGRYLSAAEAAEYGEFKRTRREAEIAVSLHKLIVDAAARETDRYRRKAVCEQAKKLSAYGVFTSPVGIAAVKRHLSGSEVRICCRIGGTGETLLPVKKYEAKRAIAQGAGELRLVLTYSALKSGNAAYLKREVKKLRRAARKRLLVVSLEDHSLTEDDIALGTRAAVEGGADAVCVRGDVGLVLRALRVSGGKLRVDASDVENSAQLEELLRAGASLVQTSDPQKIAEEMYEKVREAIPAPPEDTP